MLGSPIEEIKSRLDIVEVVGSYIKLQKAGANYRAVCPFHSEKRPSFFVSPSRQMWHCFGGCGTGGDIFKFVMKIEGVEFGDALRALAQKAGVELKKEHPESTAWKSERQRLYEVCEHSTRFFEKQLNESVTGKLAKNYLLERGVSEDSINKWRLGYAPDVWQGLSDFLASLGYKKQEIEKAGLALTSEKGSFYDRFRGRIIFPVFDLNSQVIGFGGRVFKEKDKAEIAKYMNTPQTILYDKGRTLYGLDKAKVAIRKKDSCVMVEGYMDLIMASQAGTENIVATSGTALTSFHLRILKRYTENLCTAFDMDVAGDAATKRGIDLAQSQGFNVKVITLPDGLDPADVALKSREEWGKYVSGAKSIMDFYFETTFAKFDKQAPEGKSAIAKILLPVIKRIPNKIVQSHWASELAKKIQIREEDVEEEMKKVKIENIFEQADSESFSPPLQKSRRNLLEERVAQLALASPIDVRKNFIAEDCLNLFTNPLIKEILINIRDNQDLCSEKLSPASGDLFSYLSFQGEAEEIEEKDLAPEINCCLREIKFLDVREKLDQLSKDIRRAEESSDLEKIKELTQEFHSCSRSLYDLETA